MKRASVFVVAAAIALATQVASGTASAARQLAPLGSVRAVAMTAGVASAAQGGAASPRRLRLGAGPQARAVISASRLGHAGVKVAAGAVIANAATSTGPIVFGDKLGASAFNEIFCCTPPDSTGAIGPLNYVEAVNQLVTVYDRNLVQVSQLGMGAFVGASIGLVSDPQLEWDASWNRWVYAATVVQLHNNSLVFGWSMTADPTNLGGGWCRFGVGLGNSFDDYPKLGHSDSFLTIGANVFDDTTGSFMPVTADIWAIPKPAAASTCGAPTAFHFANAATPLRNADGSLSDTPVPANTADALTGAYVVAAHTPVGLGPQRKVAVWHVTAGPTLVADGDITVVSYDMPAPAAQPGSTMTIDTLDGRLTQAVAHVDPDVGAEAIWTQHTVAGPSGVSMVRWYEILPSTLVVRQEGTVAFPGFSVYNAAISPSIAGNDAVIEFNISSSSLVPISAAQSRRALTPAGTMDPGLSFLAVSSQADSDISCTPTCRWGDYSGATPDPVFPHVVWGSNQVFARQVAGLPDWVTTNFLLYVAP